MAGEGLSCEFVLLSLPDTETAIARVAERVRQGGHHVPEGVIRRRFTAGLRNMEHWYKFAVDAWAKYDSDGESPVLQEWGEHLRP